MRILKKIKPVVWILLFTILFFSLINPRFFSISNFQNILQQASSLMVLAFAETLIILMQGTDLSLGAQVSLSTIVFVTLAAKGIPLPLCIVAVIFCTVLIGIANGAVISYLKVPTFISTLGMQNIVKSLALLICGSRSIYYSSEIIQKIAWGRFLYLPITTWVAAFTFLLAWLVLNRTRLGSEIYAIGGNVEALKVAGVNQKIARMKAWAFSGVLAGIAGFLVVCRVESGQPAVGDGMEFNAIAAVLLGGTSMREGKGGLFGTIFGVLLIYCLKNGLNLSGLPSIYHNAILGSVVLIAIVVDALINRAASQEKA